MARLCIHCQCVPRFCSWRSVPFPRHWCRRLSVCAADGGLCLGRLGDDQAKGRARTSRVHRLQNMWGTYAFTRQALHELRRQISRTPIQSNRMKS